jgi:Mrp family chromosome partitioning ATPase
MGAISVKDRFEPTVVGAVRRYWMMVLMVALLTAAAAVSFSMVVPEVYRAHATVTVPPMSLSGGEDSSQYLESQVLLLQSPEVADRAARIANGMLNEEVLSASDFAVDAQSLEITPPEGTSPGSYGSGIITVSFTWPDRRVAQAGTNAVLQAFDDARMATITAEAEATVAGIETAIRDARTRGQLKDLVNQRTETLVKQQVDLARHPTVVWATEPQQAVNGNSKRSGAIGLVVGTILGAGLAYALAIRRRPVPDSLSAVEIYDAPLLCEVGARKLPVSIWRAEPLPVVAEPQSARAEAFRFAARSVEQTRVALTAPLVVAFVSTRSGSDRSPALANLALASAESGTSVLAVDADPSSGALTDLLLADSAITDGFAQVLNGTRAVSDCIQSSPLNWNLAVLGCGEPCRTRRTGVAYRLAVEELIGKAKASFDLVLIESPALLHVADAAELVSRCDAAVVLVGEDDPVRDHILTAEHLQRVGIDVLGYIYDRSRATHSFAGLAKDRSYSASSRGASTATVPTW